jgi:SAM-dependent methyltransferase
MRTCIETYLSTERHYRILDFGSRIPRSQDWSHRDLLEGYDCTIRGADIAKGRNVDVVMSKPYRLPVPSHSVDVILTGQAFEHIPFAWASILELARVLRPRGLIFLTAPSRGHVHDVQDCWRYYPDAMRSLAAFARLHLREAHTDFPPTTRGQRFDYASIDTKNYYWGDTVGVFQKPRNYSKLVSLARGPIIWWANRVGGIEHVPAPKPVSGREHVPHR